ncbi:MAG: Binding-protein-dependent transport systems inner membrane component [Thermotoga sp. 50_1627]|uniref:ABC transporter permease n=1 Tax=Pseudothermotoga sp. TaxID=2033661 RepID=UPI00076D297F|nr:MAG: Binding-protein-dependent transport systems inner membrane component [Thermotoga sp. 50_64]KUK24737.1 MAG: Binding-protein-dependent transport systems inner membrane component [Thermotoga sp. 50_1627]MBC7116500.1 ABC transporter permease [Pseudothermotoga sp.]MDK2923109.1 tungstate transport system permease protein [Pseudothermotoga sp.]HBT40358.1 ABC transporter permease [Pseudothermotoga sp.]
MSELVEISLRSIYVNCLATLIASLIGVPLALLLNVARPRFRDGLVLIFQTLVGIPPVLVGLVLWLLLSRSGPLGGLNLLYTTTVMIVAQILIALPIIVTMCHSHFARVDEKIKLLVRTLGADKLQFMGAMMRESLSGVLSAILTAFGRVAGEVGAVMIVGGNILGKTRVLTTSIVLYTNTGQFEKAILAGIILLFIAFTVNLTATLFSKRSER